MDPPQSEHAAQLLTAGWTLLRPCSCLRTHLLRSGPPPLMRDHGDVRTTPWLPRRGSVKGKGLHAAGAQGQGTQGPSTTLPTTAPMRELVQHLPGRVLTQKPFLLSWTSEGSAFAAAWKPG